MPKERARPGSGRSFYALATACGTLTVAAAVSAIHPAPDAVVLPRADRAPAVQLDEHWEDVDETAPIGGPLQIPTIGVVPDDYDERYAALEAARAVEDTDESDVVDDDRLPPAVDDDIPEPSDGDAHSPPEPAEPADAPPVPAVPAAPPPVAPEPSASAAAPPPAETPPAETPPAQTPPVEQPDVPTPEVPTPEAPTLEVPTLEVPTLEVPTPEVPPSTPEPAPATPPAPEPPESQELALGERYDHLDADGRLLYSLTLVQVRDDVSCTPPASLPAENGHLIGLQLEVVQVSPDDTEAPILSPTDFQFVEDDVRTEDLDTDSAAACLADDDEQPDEPTLVLDVPALTGRLVYAPEAGPAALHWQL